MGSCRRWLVNFARCLPDHFEHELKAIAEARPNARTKGLSWSNDDLAGLLLLTALLRGGLGVALELSAEVMMACLTSIISSSP